MRSDKTEQAAKRKYRPEIDGLRAFAVITVIINHFNKDILPGGYLGVDIFFVISGYVITSSLESRREEKLIDFIGSFYERRIKRIFPALLVCVVITTTLAFAFIPEPQTVARTAIASIFGLSNLYLYQNSTPYFSQASDLNLFTQTWSLGIEEQFYLLFPVLAWFSGFSREKLHAARNLSFAIGCFAIPSVILFACLYPTNQPAAYFLLPSRSWEIAVGCLTFTLTKKETIIGNAFQKPPAIFALILILGIQFLPIDFAIFSTVSTVLLSGLLIYSIKKGSFSYQLLTKQKVIYLGVISYSLYLWHWPILSLARWTIGVTAFTTLPLLLLILGISILSFEYIERPFRKSVKLPRMALFSTFVLVTSFLASAIFAIQRVDTHWHRFFFLGQKSKDPHLDEQKNKRFFILGDSYARDVYTILPPNIKSEKFILDGCAFFDFSTNRYNKCVLHAKNWRELISKLKDGDIILAISANTQDIPKLKSFLKKTLPVIQGKNVTFAIRAPFPEFETKGQNGYLCQEEWFRPKASIDSGCSKMLSFKRSEASKLAEDFREKLRPITNEYSNLVILDYSQLFCDDLQCSPWDSNNGKSFTHDGGHLYRWSNELTERMSRLLKRQLELN